MVTHHERTAASADQDGLALDVVLQRPAGLGRLGDNQREVGADVRDLGAEVGQQVLYRQLARLQADGLTHCRGHHYCPPFNTNYIHEVS